MNFLCVYYVVLQAVGDPGQGWGNAILFIFLSPNVRHRLFRGCCQIKTKLSASHLTSPVSDADEGDFATSYQLNPTSSSSSSRVDMAVNFTSSGSGSNSPLLHSRGGNRRGHSRTQQKSPVVISGNSSIISSLFLDD